MVQVGHASQAIYLIDGRSTKFKIFRCDCVRKMPLSGLDSSMFLGWGIGGRVNSLMIRMNSTQWPQTFPHFDDEGLVEKAVSCFEQETVNRTVPATHTRTNSYSHPWVRIH